MSVATAFDPPGEISREFWLVGATLKTQVNASTCTIPILTRKVVAELAGPTTPTRGALFLSLTDTERTNYVFDRIKLPGLLHAGRHHRGV